MAKISFVGLGVMGYPMARHLIKAGHDVTVYNRTTTKAEQWVNEYGGKLALTPREAAIGADMVMSCVGNDDDVRSVYYGENGIFAGVKKGVILIDHTTASADLARELYQAAKELGFDFLDAPVSGGQAGAENAALTVMCGGDEAIFNAAEDVLKIYGKAVTLVGESGCGQLCKMANQLCIAGVLAGVSEAVRFAQKAGLDVKTVRDVVKMGSGSSWQLENRAETMGENKFDFGFAIDWIRKDLGFCFDEAERNGAKLPFAKQIDEAYAQLQQRGLGRCDTSALIRFLDDK
ncbi:NAD(P)-dependent oxidoreductase [Budviciaceae bacterium CWB-B4]|uniref:NAD(P)-dependent oxidoreductase n=1 Tax=Limnobaculum xujianqingii TaxID=2738837 RepID=A0A9D7AJZ5_9GAMM|nr:NAD(P)-dependent oxidoreductase [Limnobaculum xujianqingii]MBK5073739.1 NAD(P)-dependent oxidoreductase [Limnobaculum xujianqingii]MBK5177367.1 NAD(P)-dependent oxidoreductase [Limnobaculum xujianqingii]